MKPYLLLLMLVVTIPSLLPAELPKKDPWLTGPLLAPSGRVIPVGHQKFEPYLFAFRNREIYNAHWGTDETPAYDQMLARFIFEFGICPNVEVDFTPQFLYNETQGRGEFRLSDMPVGFAFQLRNDTGDEWHPAIKLILSSNIPLGKYQKLSLDKGGSDRGGLGFFSLNTGLVFTHTYPMPANHFFAYRYYLFYQMPNQVHVRGKNAYGGGSGTSGKVYPGHVFTTILGMEYTLTKNWVVALDLEYLHVNKTRFSGHTVEPNTKPSSEQFSLSPAIEYNFGPNFGIVTGPWFTVAGRNSSDFASWVIAFYIIH